MIFKIARDKQDRIMKIRRAEGQKKITTEEQNDPFGLYCSYLNTIKPIDYEFDVVEYKKKICSL